MHIEDIKAALRKQGTTLADLAKELNVSRSAISHTLLSQRSHRIEAYIARKVGLPLREVFPQRYGGDETAAQTVIKSH
jgi:Ner family transcriptional regulator